MSDTQNMINAAVDALAAVVPKPPFKEVWTYDRGRVDALPGITMDWGGAKRADEYGIRAVKHLHKWLIPITVRVWVRTDPADSRGNDRPMRENVAALVDAIEADPTLGGKVDASGVTEISEPFLMTDARKQVVGQGVDIRVSVMLSGPWTQ